MRSPAYLCPVIFLPILLTLNIFTPTLLADQIFHYQTMYEPADGKPFDGEPLNNFSITIGDLKDQKRMVAWLRKEGEGYNKESYVLDDRWATMGWQVFDTKDIKEYAGIRKNNLLIIDGKIKKKYFTRDIKIDRDPFYFNPKLGLRYFVESGKPSMTFWAMRHDKLTVHKMRAVNKGIESINVNGKTVKATRVDWSAVAGFTKYFSRTYWFRMDDGAYVKQKVWGSKIRVLIDEE